MQNQDTRNKNSVSHELNYWLSLASFNGFNRLVESKPKIRFAWFFAIIIAYICMCYHVSQNFQQYFSYPVNTKVEYGKYDVRFPDLTICPVGMPTEYHDFDDRVVIGDVLYRRMFDKVKIDRNIYQFYYFNKVNYFTNANYTTGHIGSYLVVCNFLGQDCDFRNFTLLRDPVFTDCFTFRPNDNYIPRQGHVLTLGLYTNKSLIEYDPDFIAILHEHGTLPNIATNGFKIRSGGRTDLTFKTTEIKYLNTPVKHCSEHNYVKYLFTKDDGMYNYTEEDCFIEAVQRKMVKKMKCVNPLIGITEEFVNVPRCLRFPEDLSRNAIRFAMLTARLNYDFRYGTKRFTPENLRELRKLKVRGQPEFATALQWITDEFQTFNNLIQSMVLNYQEILANCTFPCKKIKIDSWATYNGFTSEDVDRIIEFSLPKHRYQEILILKHSKTLKNLYNNIARAMLNYLEELNLISTRYDRYMHQKKYQAQQINITKKFEKNMAYLDVSVVNVPGDGMIEERSYEAVNLLSDLGGNIGLWVGFSVISTFELIELCVLLTMAVRNKKQLRKEVKKNDAGTGSVPLVEGKPDA